MVGQFCKPIDNYADVEVPFTRIHEFRHYHEERQYPEDKTVIFKEYSTGMNAASNPYYPINTKRDREILDLYLSGCSRSQRTYFCGRLGSYRYLDMDQAISEALLLYETKIKKGIE